MDRFLSCTTNRSNKACLEITTLRLSCKRCVHACETTTLFKAHYKHLAAHAGEFNSDVTSYLQMLYPPAYFPIYSRTIFAVKQHMHICRRCLYVREYGAVPFRLRSFHLRCISPTTRMNAPIRLRLDWERFYCWGRVTLNFITTLTLRVLRTDYCDVDTYCEQITVT